MGQREEPWAQVPAPPRCAVQPAQVPPLTGSQLQPSFLMSKPFSGPSSVPAGPPASVLHTSGGSEGEDYSQKPTRTRWLEAIGLGPRIRCHQGPTLQEQGKTTRQ